MKRIRRHLWRLWYAFNVVPSPWPPGKGDTKDNPLDWDDLRPLLTMLRRTGQRLDGAGLHDDPREWMGAR